MMYIRCEGETIFGVSSETPYIQLKAIIVLFKTNCEML